MTVRVGGTETINFLTERWPFVAPASRRQFGGPSTQRKKAGETPALQDRAGGSHSVALLPDNESFVRNAR